MARVGFFFACAVAYVLAQATRKFHRLPVLLAASALVAVLLVALGPQHREAFHAGISAYSWFLGPMTVALAIPLEQARRREAIPIARSFGVLAASAIIGVGLMVAIGKIFRASHETTATLLPRAATNALSVPTSEAIGGVPATTSLVVAISGVVVAVIGPRVLTWLKIHDPIARGLALGGAGHLVATARAYEESELAGAASSFALVVHGVITVLACLALRFFVAF